MSLTDTKTRELVVYNIPGGALWAIKLDGGGQVPYVLKGSYTSYDYAAAAIDRYKRAKEG